MTTREPPTPGPLEDDKRADDAEPGEVQPQAAEVESARLLANHARPRLRDAGLSDDQIGRLADEFIARDRGEDADAFVAWARDRATHHSAQPPPPP
jgi:hypothetical protein